MLVIGTVAKRIAAGACNYIHTRFPPGHDVPVCTIDQEWFADLAQKEIAAAEEGEGDTPPTGADRDRFLKGWAALRDACRKQHPKGPGGAAICACGAACGGSDACSMLRILRDLIAASDDRPAWWRNYMAALRSVAH